MNKRQKLVQQRFLNNEEAVTKALEKTYETALADVNKKIKKLQLDIDGIQGQLDVWEDFGGDAAEKEKLQSILRSKVYQKRYQQTIQGQLDDVLDKMHTESYKTVDAYLNGCYDEAYIGAFYDMHGQGVPLVMPIDQEAVVRAVQIDSKISNGLYSRLGEDVAGLKKTITAEVSRGIANGSTYAQVAQQISFKMVGAYDDRPGGAFYRALTIARTEGGRIQSKSALDACHKAKDIGADVVKQWDSTLDGITRPSHRRVDGEIRELDEPFSNGLYYPRDPSGGAAEVVNCRCALLQRARWAIEAGFTKMNNFTKEIETFESPEDYNEFKKAFWSKENQDFMKKHTDLEKKYGTKDFKKLLESMDDEEYAQYMKLYGNSPIYNKAAKAKVKTATVKNDAEYQARIKARREAYKQRKAMQSTPDFDSMDKESLEKYAAEHLKTQFEDTKGVNTDYFKEVVKITSKFESKMGGKTIDGLSVKFGAVPKGFDGKYDDKTHTLLLKKRVNLKSFAEAHQEYNARSMRKLNKNYFASNDYQGIVWHEIGHAVDIDTGQALSRSLSATKELDQKSIKISVYAGSTQNVRTTKRSEAWAENFAAYMGGGETAKDVPPEIAEMIEDYFKKKK